MVTLAPSADGQLVTSQRGQITAVHPETGTLVVLMDDSHVHTLGPEQAGPDRLALGYATTVHRSQGATFDIAHFLGDGGGRELAHVAMSRAREAAHVHAVADDLDQAVDDVGWDWTRERRQTWAIDTGTPEHEVLDPLLIEADGEAPASLRATLGRARLKVERSAVAAVGDRTDADTRIQLRELDVHTRDLDQRLDPRGSVMTQDHPRPQRDTHSGSPERN